MHLRIRLDHVRGRIEAEFADLGEKAPKHRSARSGLCAWGRRHRLREGLDARTARAAEAAFRARDARRCACRAGHRDRRRRVVGPQREPARNVAAKAPAEAARLSIVVLPFANLRAIRGRTTSPTR